MKPNNKNHNKQVGSTGEGVACEFLMRNGYQIREQNYWAHNNEIDIIAEKHHQIYFVEVKTVSYETKLSLEQSVAHETWRPEEQVHHKKLQNIYKTAAIWLEENNCEKDWIVAVAAIRLVSREMYATVNFIENV